MMKRMGLAVSVLALAACGGDSGGGSAPSLSSGQALSASTTNVVLSGKQFSMDIPRQQVALNSSDEVRIVIPRIAGDARAPDGDDPRVPTGERIFSNFIPTNGSFVEISADNAFLPGGTYEDVLTLEPQLDNGSSGNIVRINLTLIQEPTAELTAELNEPDQFQVEIVEGGPDVVLQAAVVTGNTIRWRAEPGSFDADAPGVVFMSAAPSEGVGSEAIAVTISPTPALIAMFERQDTLFTALALQDLDNISNVAELQIEISLAEDIAELD